MKTSTRIIEFDIIKCLAIFLVLWGHSIQHLYPNGNTTPVFVVISMFHMPLFMIISGFFSAKALRLSFHDMLKKKFVQLLFPCLTFGLIFLLIIYLIKAAQFNLSGSASYLYSIFWFLKCLFVCFVLVFVCNKLSHNMLWGGVIAIIVSQFIPIFKINYMMPFFVIGYGLSVKFNLFLRYRKTIAIVSSIVFIICAFTLFEDKINFGMVISKVKQGFLNGYVYVAKDYAIVQTERLMLGLSGSLVVISLVFQIPGFYKNAIFADFLSKYGRETLGIYIIQTLLLESLMPRVVSFRGMNVFLYTLLVAPMISVAMMWVCYKISVSIRKTQITNKLLYLK